MLRIGLAIDDGLDRPDGVQQIILTLGRRLTALGHEVHYLTSATERTDLPHLHVLSRTVSVKFNGNRLGTPLPLRRSAARALLTRLDLDVLHVAMPYSPFLAGQLVSAAGPRTAVTGSFMIYPQDALTRWGIRALGTLERRRLRRFDALSALSEAAQESAEGAYHRPVPVIGAPVELPAPVSATHDGPPRIVFLGRLVERKGPRELIAAAGALHRADPDRRWTLTLAGRGPLLDELRSAADREGLGERVDFPGFVAEEDKTALLAGADLVVLPSLGGESFGISVVEAQAVATGVVLAGDNPGYRTTMAGLEAQLVDPRDTAGFARLLARWLDDPDGRAAVVPAQRRAAQRFEAGAITEQTLAWYDRALARRRG
ncbi:glycosyltransferase family 4 protein [Cellulomonas denverensis]|uniref:D-inositol 3-phosphate glycosyltransferase n=1 Tax=Cellulomonas denverensis TaxID=264297 RepID=A0A7X6R0D4_9CELL|nr:glycosyltransferase family 4 protein [Cellulomonas denverensis]NKY24052.1 glycosyltransferase family 4 protein [Cellulomonas denverensis]GIG26537.1 putative phosphatidylinositol alpha-mannosyltransferase [Cellulomonas denverensis]